MILSSDLLFDRALQGVWQNAPCIRFDLKMLTYVRMLEVPSQGFFDVDMG
jgi:hypothetical protein